MQSAIITKISRFQLFEVRVNYSCKEDTGKVILLQFFKTDTQEFLQRRSNFHLLNNFYKKINK